MDVVAEKFEDIKKNFKAGAKKKGYEWDEDLLSDAILSCYNSLKDKKLSVEEILKYLWVSYINKYKNKYRRDQRLKYVDEWNDDEWGIMDESEYQGDVDEIYNSINSGLEDKYGVRSAFIWNEHVCQGKTQNEIKKMGMKGVDNYMYFTRKIKRYINNHIIKEDRRLKELIREKGYKYDGK